MEHLTDEVLLRFLEQGSSNDRGPVLEHLVICEHCSARYAEMLRTRPAEQPPARFRPEEFAARGRRLYPARTRGPFGLPAGWRMPLPAVAAVALLLVVAGGYFLLRTGPATPIYRGETPAAAVQLVAPVDETVARADLAFKWRGLPNGETAHLQVIDLSNPARPILDRNVSGSTYAPTSAERDRLQTGITYRWFLQYRTEAGATKTSRAAKFAVRQTQ